MPVPACGAASPGAQRNPNPSTHPPSGTTASLSSPQAFGFPPAAGGAGAALRRALLDSGQAGAGSLPLWEAHAALLDAWVPFLVAEAQYAADVLLLRE